MSSPVPVVDVFAGPGGLNEGFSSVGTHGNPTFETVASVEMDPTACSTLTLRAAVRRARRVHGEIPDVYFDFTAGVVPWDGLTTHPAFAAHLKHAVSEVHQHELSTGTRDVSDQLIGDALRRARAGDDDPWVLVGGPPCQAYSLVGRSRRRHDTDFSDDVKHTLYREYLNIIAKHRPHVFVMENVKGMLSSTHDGGQIFRAIQEDLRNPGNGDTYELRSFVEAAPEAELSPRDFIIRAEKYGVPQARHRVIIMGVRSDLGLGSHRALPERDLVPIEEVIGDLPAIRSGLSPKASDSWQAWLEARIIGSREARVSVEKSPRELRLGTMYWHRYKPRISGDLADWLLGDRGPGLTHHESRSHMLLDLARYEYLALMAREGQNRRLHDLPASLMPLHKNVTRTDAPFVDRFRVQREGRPSSTIASHIAKDGHYYIHYDHKQMRSLTVREAARLQTFPDNYFFMGRRTHQYHQVGNAVPPYLARQLGEVVAEVLGLPL